MMYWNICLTYLLVPGKLPVLDGFLFPGSLQNISLMLQDLEKSYPEMKQVHNSWTFSSL